MKEDRFALFEKAVVFAVEAHAGQKRKGKEKPYILHPLEVAAIVGTYSNDPEVLAAAVLHDTVEDTQRTIEDIRREFGSRVAYLVAGESENKREELPAESTWQVRKQETIDHLETAGKETKLICLGDKLANIREMAADHAAIGDKLWKRFNQKDPAMHGWYYGSVLKVLEKEFGKSSAIEEYAKLGYRVFGESFQKAYEG